MKILLTNDDGIESEGILALARRLSEKHSVIVVAPQRNQSAKSHSITMRGKQSLKRWEEGGTNFYAFDGTPADCVQFAETELGYDADIVISGINNGMNLGSDVLYSGTVGAAMDGAHFGMRAIAVSLYYDYSDAPETLSFDGAAAYIEENLLRFYRLLSPGMTLNVNVPLAPECGEAFCPLGFSNYDQKYSFDGEHYTLQGIPFDLARSEEGCDLWYASRGYITLTPLLLNFTDRETLARWKKM